MSWALLTSQYTWTRDPALTLSTLFPSLQNPSQSYETESLSRSYISLQASLQQLDTRSGDLWSGGLAEPKFMVDGSAFKGDWGRPQR
jgi:glucoamylase